MYRVPAAEFVCEGRWSPDGKSSAELDFVEALCRADHDWPWGLPLGGRGGCATVLDSL